jgi:hypothetical protein
VNINGIRFLTSNTFEYLLQNASIGRRLRGALAAAELRNRCPAICFGHFAVSALLRIKGSALVGLLFSADSEQGHDSHKQLLSSIVLTRAAASIKRNSATLRRSGRLRENLRLPSISSPNGADFACSAATEKSEQTVGFPLAMRQRGGNIVVTPGSTDMPPMPAQPPTKERGQCRASSAPPGLRLVVRRPICFPV